MRAARAIVALLLTLVVYAHGRELQQGGIAIAVPGGLPTVTNSTSAASPWSNYTREVNTLYIGVKPISSTVAASDEACASLCNNDQRCEWFAWCPQNVTNGCGIPAANSTFTSNVPPGGCVITYDNVPERWAVFVAYGNAVPFVSGRFAPPDATANGTASPTTRKLLQGGGAGATVWGNFTRVKRTFWQGIDGLPPTTAQTAEECAGACNANSKCELWSLCPPAAGAGGCEVASFDEKASPVAVPGGTCLLSYDGTPDQLAYFEIQGYNVSFEAGKRQSEGSSGTSPPIVPGPIINIPIPGVSPPVGSIIPPVGSISPPIGSISPPIGSISPPIGSISPPVGGISPAPLTPGGGTIIMAPANASNAIISTNVYSVKGIACPYFNGSAWGFNAINQSRYWLASSKVAAIDWDKALDLADRLCASRAAAGPTLLAAFEEPGSEEANIAAAAAAQTCVSGGNRLGSHYMHAGNPDDDYSDGSRAAEYASKWLAAADAAGYGLCVAIGQFDRSGALVPGTERFVHNPTPWSGSGNPANSYIRKFWFLPDKGQPTTCSAWNGTAFIRDTARRKGTVTTPSTVDMNAFYSYLGDVCSNAQTAGGTLAAAINAGGPTADLAALASLYTCGNKTAASDLRLDREVSRRGAPIGSRDWQRAMNYSRQWVAALDRIGYPFCVTVAFYEDGRPINATQVYPGGEAPTPVDTAAPT